MNQHRQQSFRNLLRTCTLAFVATGMSSSVAWSQSESGPSAIASVIRQNAPDEPRDTPLTRPAMKQYIEDLKNRTPRFKLPELSDEEKKQESEQPRLFGYEARLRKLYLGENIPGSYNGFFGSASNANNPNRAFNPPDPAMSLDYPFKVRLFWIAARANNCQYCLGHQESKLLAAGMEEDAIAALDSDWTAFPDKEQVAFALAKRLTNDPQLLSDADIDACRAHYSDLQILEMVGAIAGYNAINRWKEGTGVPQSSNGGNFGGPAGASSSSSAESHSYLTPTSKKFIAIKTRVAKAKPEDTAAEAKLTAPTRYIPMPLETGDALQAALTKVSSRTPRLPLADEATTRTVMGELASDKVPQWMRLLANFSVAGKNMAIGLSASQKSDELTPLMQAKIDWVVARQDRAWYAAALAKDQLLKNGGKQSDLDALDGDLSSSKNSGVTDRERALLVVAKNLAASPIVLTDRQVSTAIEVAGPRAVLQTINYTTYRAAFDRMTEAALLAKD